MAAIKLFNKTVNIIRTSGKPYLDDNNNIVAGTTTSVPVECNIQPYRQGITSLNSDTGYRTVDAIKVYVPEEFSLQTYDEIKSIAGDQLVYKGKEYFCKELEEWDAQTYDGLSLIPAHNLGYFYRKDKT